MNTIKLKSRKDVPQDYTGIVEWDNESKAWFKNGNLHREDGPAVIYYDDYKKWYLDGNFICSSYSILDLTNKTILSKQQHQEYPLVQVWKVLGPNVLYEQLINPGMEKLIIE